MREVQIPEYINYYRELMPELRGIKHTYFSGLRVIAFVDDEDATMFMLRYPATMGSAVEYFKRVTTRSSR